MSTQPHPEHYPDGHPPDPAVVAAARRTLIPFLVLSFALMLLVLAPFALGMLAPSAIGAAVPLAQWAPGLASLLLLRGTGLGPSVRATRPAPWRVWRGLSLTVATFGAVLLAHLGLSLAVGWLGWHPSPTAASGAVLVLPVAVALSLGTAGEELGWRGHLLTALSGLGRWRSALAAALVWAAWHLPLLAWYSSEGELTVRSAVMSLGNLVAGGVLLGVLRWRTGSVWPAVAGHALMNSLLVWGYSALVDPIDALADGPFWAVAVLGWGLLLGAAAVVSRRT